MLNVTTLITFLNYDDLVRKNIIPDLVNLCIIPSTYDKLYNVKLLNCENFLGTLVENIITKKIINTNFNIEHYYKKVNPGYYNDLNYLWPNYHDNINKTLIQLNKHLNYTDNYLHKIKIKVKCYYAKIIGEIDFLYNNQICEIKSNKIDVKNLQLAMLQCLTYVCLLRHDKHNIRYITLIYPIEKRIYTLDLINWDEKKFMLYLYFLNKKL